MLRSTESRSAVLIAVALACSLRMWLASAESCDTSETAKCGPVSTVENCLYRNCTDPNRSVDVSFRVCQFPWPANGPDTVSVYAYTNVTCGCPRGDVTVQVRLPNMKIADYSTLGATPDPGLLNVSRCATETEDSDAHSYCIKFTDLSMAEEVNGSSLVAEVNKAVLLSSSKSCLKIIIPATIPPSPPPTGDATTPPSPPPTGDVVLMSDSQPCQGPFVFTCTTSERSPQMRVSIQNPTQTRPVEHTVPYLRDSDSYIVSFSEVSSASEPNTTVRLTVTIRNVSHHVGTRYHCVQHHDDGTIRSEELVIMNCSAATAALPITSKPSEEQHVSVTITVSQQWSAEHDQWSVGVQWKIAASVNLSNVTVTRLCYPSGEGSQELKIVAPTEKMAILLVPTFVRNCSVVVEMFQGDRVLATGHASLGTVGKVSIDKTSPETLVEDSKESSQLSPLTVAASVVGVCIFSALILFVLLLGVGLRVRYKRKHSRPKSSGEQGGLPSNSATNPIYAMATEPWSHVQSGYPTGTQNENPDDGITLMENPAYVGHVYTQVYPTLSTRPRPTPSLPNSYNIGNSTSDHDYI